MWELNQRTFPWAYNWPRAKLLHWEDHEFVGPEFARELVELYFRKCTFVLHERDIALLDTFLQQSVFNIGLLVAQHIHRLHLQLTFSKPGMHNSDSGYVVSQELAMDEILERVHALPEMLEPLKRIRARCDVSLTFGVWSNEVGLFQFLRTAEALIPLISELEANGCTFIIHVQRLDLKSYGSTEFLGEWLIPKPSCSKTETDALRKAYEVSRIVICNYSYNYIGANKA
jgi:hypothetical protein